MNYTVDDAIALQQSIIKDLGTNDPHEVHSVLCQIDPELLSLTLVLGALAKGTAA